MKKQTLTKTFTTQMFRTELTFDFPASYPPEMIEAIFQRVQLHLTIISDEIKARPKDDPVSKKLRERDLNITAGLAERDFLRDLTVSYIKEAHRTGDGSIPAGKPIR